MPQIQRLRPDDIVLYTKLGRREDVLHFDIAPLRGKPAGHSVIRDSP